MQAGTDENLADDFPVSGTSSEFGHFDEVSDKVRDEEA